VEDVDAFSEFYYLIFLIERAKADWTFSPFELWLIRLDEMTTLGF